MDDQKLLQQIARMTEDNNKILHSMRRAQRWGRLMRLVWWSFIIGTSAAAYYYLQPFILGILETYEKILGDGRAAGAGSPSLLLDKGLAEQIMERIRQMIEMMK